MRTLFSGEVWLSYSQMYLQTDGFDPLTAFAGQSNGLCGAAAPGGLHLVTGLHTGEVPLVVEEHDAEPPVPEGWEEVVEVSFEVTESPMMLLGCLGGEAGMLALTLGSRRARYCAAGMEAGREADTRSTGEPVADRYLLQLWPAPPAADVVVRQTSETAAYWHAHARSLPPPPTPEEVAEAERVAAEQVRARRVEFEIGAYWEVAPPSARLRGLGGNVIGVARSDRDLLDGFEALEPAVQREAARWLARRAYEIAGIDGTGWARQALAALDRGEPPPFDLEQGLRYAQADLRGPMTTATVVIRSGNEPPVHRPVHRPSFAVGTIFSALADDPLQALVDTFSHAAATFDERRAELVAELRARYPSLG